MKKLLLFIASFALLATCYSQEPKTLEYYEVNEYDSIKSLLDFYITQYNTVNSENSVNLDSIAKLNTLLETCNNLNNTLEDSISLIINTGFQLPDSSIVEADTFSVIMVKGNSMIKAKKLGYDMYADLLYGPKRIYIKFIPPNDLSYTIYDSTFTRQTTNFDLRTSYQDQ